jgi:ADP-heptose:LPS heptosyltransferase
VSHAIFFWDAITTDNLLYNQTSCSQGNGLLERIAVFRALRGVGDILCFIPALRSLRTAFPNAHLYFLGLAETRSLMSRFNRYVDTFIPFPGWPGLPEQVSKPKDIECFLNNMQSMRLDIAIQMHGDGSITNNIIELLGAQTSAGFFDKDVYRSNKEYFLPWLENESEIHRCLRLAEVLGAPSQGGALEFPLSRSDTQDAETIQKLHGLTPCQYICIHPGASDALRQWKLEHFAAVADTLASYGFKIVLTGTAEESSLTDYLARRMKATAVNLAGYTSLGALAALVADARLLVCNDTGVSHLASALSTPSVVVFNGSQRSNPDRWAPLNSELHRVIHKHSADASPHDFGRRFTCIPEITPNIVLSEAQCLLEKDSFHVASHLE